MAYPSQVPQSTDCAPKSVGAAGVVTVGDGSGASETSALHPTRTSVSATTADIEARAEFTLPIVPCGRRDTPARRG
ncbi:hypothetical protein GCM10007304_18750 [Rhodococcoides trifolii]|uniref:Uncharacterized protein n=1 Tax=Rhodococcoides trifolii TaxID=908250 RepID=A0A917D179_9NOCA|nr:hypothetical protein GCM10007304_18750 [Rhodococcus trifolii]